MTNQTFPVGQRVRFRLGERGPRLLPCCGQYLDYWEYLKGFSGQTFQVKICDLCFCPFCRTFSQPSGELISLEKEWEIDGILYGGFGAYPQELELVLDEGR